MSETVWEQGQQQQRGQRCTCGGDSIRVAACECKHWLRLESWITTSGLATPARSALSGALCSHPPCLRPTWCAASVAITSARRSRFSFSSWILRSLRSCDLLSCLAGGAAAAASASAAPSASPAAPGRSLLDGRMSALLSSSSLQGVEKSQLPLGLQPHSRGRGSRGAVAHLPCLPPCLTWPGRRLMPQPAPPASHACA